MRQPDLSNPVQKRMTRQLAAVYEAVVEDASHPSAEAIYRRVRQSLPHIGLGTVYRNLQRLTEEGKVRVLVLGKRTTRYDAVAAEHDHFICQKCGQVLDLLLERDRHIDVAPLVDQGLLVTTQSVLLHGLCRQCGEKRRPTESNARDPFKEGTVLPRGREPRDVL